MEINRTQIIVAIIALISAVSVALIENIPKDPCDVPWEEQEISCP